MYPEYNCVLQTLKNQARTGLGKLLQQIGRRFSSTAVSFSRFRSSFLLSQVKGDALHQRPVGPLLLEQVVQGVHGALHEVLPFVVHGGALPPQSLASPYVFPVRARSTCCLDRARFCGEQVTEQVAAV